MKVEYDRRITLRDGVEVSADVYLPGGVTEVVAVVARTPYNKNAEFNLKKARQYVDQGYAFIWVDVRGRGDSDGKARLYRGEGEDGFDVVEWVAAQSWCSGDVVTWGASYLGAIQHLTALQKPPHLRAMVVYVTPSDPFVDSPTGVHSPIEVSWYRLVHSRVQQLMDGIDWQSAYRHLPLIDMDHAAGFHSQTWHEDHSHDPSDTEYWAPLAYQKRLDQIDLPVLHVTGWYDDVQPGTIENFTLLAGAPHDEASRSAQRLVIGPWGHGLTRTRERQLDGLDFGDDWYFDLDSFEFSWLDHYVRGADNGAEGESRVQYFEMGTNVWRTSDVWPPDANERHLYLSAECGANSSAGDGSLASDAPAGVGGSSYRYDPDDPVPFLTEPTSAQIGGPNDYREVELRDDVLVFSTQQLERSFEARGKVRAELWVSTDGPDTDFMAKLIDVHPDGYCQRICDGMVRLRFREGMLSQLFVTPGEIVKVEIDLWDTSHVFLADHQIRLEVASSAFPKYDRSLNTDEPLTTRTLERVAKNTVWHGEATPSRLVLPGSGYERVTA